MTSLIEIDGLDVHLATASGPMHTVRDVSFAIEAKETFCLVGESGCGKSVTALALQGLLPESAIRTARRLMFAGEDLLRASERRMGQLRGARIATIFQDPMSSLNPTLTIGEQLTEGLIWHAKASRSKARDRAVYLLERCGISGAGARFAQFPHQFSGGQRQRIMIASALMCSPQLLIADEPTTALDVTVQAQILELMRELRQEMGLAILLITHDLGIVRHFADQVAVMYAGRIVERGATPDVLAGPLHPYTRGLLAAVPMPGITAPGTPLRTIAGTVPDLRIAQPGCSFANRCNEAVASCLEALPPLQINGPRHEYSCVHGPAANCGGARASG